MLDALNVSVRAVVGKVYKLRLCKLQPDLTSEKGGQTRHDSHQCPVKDTPSSSSL